MVDSFVFWKNVDAKLGKESLASLARNSSLNYKTLKNQRSLMKVPDLSVSFVIAQYLGVSLEYLITGKDSHPKSLGDRLYDALLEQAPAVLQGLIETYIEKRDISSAPRMA